MAGPIINHSDIAFSLGSVKWDNTLSRMIVPGNDLYAHSERLIYSDLGRMDNRRSRSNHLIFWTKSSYSIAHRLT